MQNGLPSVLKAFPEYEVLPVKMLNANTPDVLCFPEADAAGRFCRGGLWWAYSLGHAERMPKNDLPNISVNALPWGLDFAVNAEIRSSQEVMRQRLQQFPLAFDQLVEKHGHLELQAWLKFEHQPRFYHWILLTRSLPGTWKAEDATGLHRRSERNFPELRTRWLAWIREQRKELTLAQSAHMDRTNRKLNLAFRLVQSFETDHFVWNQPFASQKQSFEDAYLKLKPLIEFFQLSR